MERYFPSTSKTEMFNDIQIYSELRSDKKTCLYEYMFLQNVQKQSFDDYFNGSESYINQRIELLQNMFLGGLWIILITPPILICIRKKKNIYSLWKIYLLIFQKRYKC